LQSAYRGLSLIHLGTFFYKNLHSTGRSIISVLY
jgi:hypothetical protein